MKTTAKILLTVLGALLLLVLNLRRDIRTVSAGYDWQKAQVKDLYTSVAAVGIAEAIKVDAINSEVNERVEKVFLKEGAPVKTGDLILQLSHTRTQIDYQQSLNTFSSAETAFDNAVRDLAVQKKLLKNMAVSRQQVEEAERAVEERKAALDINKRELDIVWKRLESTRVKSTLDGIVLKLSVEEGKMVSAGQPLVTVADVSRFIVRTKVDELDIRNIKLGQAAQVTVDAFPDTVIDGRVAAIASQAEREAFAKIEVLIDIVGQRPDFLKHNLSVKARILTGEIQGGVGIPTASVAEKRGETGRVIVKNGLGIVRARSVQFGRSAGDDIEIIKGISAGDLVGIPRPKVGAP